MRFLLGVLVGYSMRGKTKLITILATVAFIVYIILPAIAILALSLDVQQRPNRSYKGTAQSDPREPAKVQT